MHASQGVLLPALGTFDIGQAVEDRYVTSKRHRAVFSLLEGRFGGVSQERGRYRLQSECCPRDRRPRHRMMPFMPRRTALAHAGRMAPQAACPWRS